MTEQEAQGIIRDRFGDERTDRLAGFLEAVCEENGNQNLVAPSTLDTIWSRHALDSAQLLFHVEQSAGSWLDIGTGGGFPGIVVAILGNHRVTMVEPRKKRADFLDRCVASFVTTEAEVLASKVETVTGQFDIISARAVASVEKLLQAASHCATPATRWILPRGRMTNEQLASLRRDRSRLFHVEHSITDPESTILIVDRRGVRP